MDQIAEIRRRYFVNKETISAIARALNLSRPTVRKHLNTTTEPGYHRQQTVAKQLGPYKERLEQWLSHDADLPRKQRRTAVRLYEGLQEEGYSGAYDSVQRYVKQWKTAHRSGPSSKQAFVPLEFTPGDVAQFDWSQEVIDLAGEETVIRVAHFRLAYSRSMFVVAYLRESLEMVMDAHNRAFAFWNGVPKQMIYDNLTTVVDKVLHGKGSEFNRRYMV